MAGHNMETVKVFLAQLLKDEPHIDKDPNLMVIRYWMKYENVKTLQDAIGKTPAHLIQSTAKYLAVMENDKSRGHKTRQTYMDDLEV